jgi:hypothetical protein
MLVLLALVFEYSYGQDPLIPNLAPIQDIPAQLPVNVLDAKPIMDTDPAPTLIPSDTKGVFKTPQIPESPTELLAKISNHGDQISLGSSSFLVLALAFL